MDLAENEQIKPLDTGQENQEQIKSDPIQDVLKRFDVSWKNTIGESEEGPLYVLWDLIESYKVDIFDVSIFTITEDFINFLNSAEELQIELASSFSVMASQLLFYKSKALLPDPGFDDEEEIPGLPPELVQQLLEYRKFQLAAEGLRDREEIATGILARDQVILPENISEGTEWLDVSLVDLLAVYSKLLNKIDAENEPENIYEIEVEEFSVIDKMEVFRQLLLEKQSFNFDELFDTMKSHSRNELVTTFLALLELTKLGEIIVRQKANFDEIRIFKKKATLS